MGETITVRILDQQRETLIERKIEPIPFRVVRKLILEANAMGMQMREIIGVGLRRDRGDWVFDLLVEGEK